MQQFSAFLILILLACQASAQVESLPPMVVEGRNVNLVGDAVSASEGVVGQTEISIRPLSRTGEVLELIPGMVVTQHSGSGKANQYFLRGFNLDHGTDFATFVDGMPINMRSHGHGQGYTDLNFVIPETIGKMTYKKGVYYADIGDFSGAGGVNIETTDRLEHNLASLGLGENGYQRALLMTDFQFGRGNTLFAVEGQRYDGPWADINEDVRKSSLLLKHTQPLSDGQVSLEFMAYNNKWNSADQVPMRAVQQGIISELGSLDDSVGGETSRYSLSMKLQQGPWRASAYAIDYDLNLWSDFTYFLDDEVNGDQFEQVDNRKIYGGQLEYDLASALAKYSMNNHFGLQFRLDQIPEVGLYQTRRRERLGVTRSDKINQSSASLFWENEVDWNIHFRTVFGARYDAFDFDVKDRAGVNRFGVDLSDNSGKTSDGLLSLKGSLIYWINDAWEAYLSGGQGIHSNDARGTTISVDPATGAAADRVDPLVRSTGYELGVRTFVGDRLNMSMALWSLELDSELLFVGDAGNTEASRPSLRKGIELVTYYHFSDNLTADFEYAYNNAEFRDDAPEGTHIPGAVKDVLQAGLNIDLSESWFSSLRYRYFGKRPLIEDWSQESKGTAIWNLRIGYKHHQWQATVDVLNLADSNDHDIDYYYESRLSSEPSGAGTGDIHFHPIEPRTIRFNLAYKW
ncbi:MAG: TonB-dependent receptor [Thiotrichales bacterium]